MKTYALIAAGLALAVSSAFAQGPGYGYGPGYGPGAGYGPGGGYGPGMMGGGPGMMRGYGGEGYGPGYGRGYGPGEGRGYGPGTGAPLAALELTAEQADKIAAIQEEVRRKNWDTMGQVRTEMFKLRRMYNADNADPKAVTEQQKKVDELRRQMLASRLETRKQIDAVLTPEQKKKADDQRRRFGPRWLDDERG